MRFRQLANLSAASAALILWTGCGDISSSQVSSMERQVDCVCSPWVDEGAFLSNHPHFKAFSEEYKKFQREHGQFKATSKTLSVDRTVQPPTATRTFVGELSSGIGRTRAELEATFELRGEEWTLVGLELNSQAGRVDSRSLSTRPAGSGR